ncbi:hypothetical protein DPMN_120365 [Dreissena polymorpha]|uniref:Uncharacterized protein n=1 Tax=Dreissena polymorpha TaxID=45954 RepID=A0A9D4JS14_DREPO|nr:hypothetical protein DPMN_120365 [Dreissena polymorpha]
MFVYPAGTTDLKYDATTGVLSVNKGVTLDKSTQGGYIALLFATPAAGSTSSTSPGTCAINVVVATCSSGVVHVTAMLGMQLLC